jgi:hypothetical protein
MVCAAIAATVMDCCYGLMDVMVYCGWIKFAWVGGLRRASLPLFFLPLLIYIYKKFSLFYGKKKQVFFLRLLDLYIGLGMLDSCRLVSSASYAYFSLTKVWRTLSEQSSTYQQLTWEPETHHSRSSEASTSCSGTALQSPIRFRKLTYINTVLLI